MAFFREYLLSLGATLPPKPAAPEAEHKEQATADREMDEDVQMDEVEEDRDEAFPKDTVDEAAQPFGDVNTEVTDEMLDRSEALKSDARTAMSDGNLERAAELFTEAILLNPGSASLISKRGEVFLKLKKPMAAIYDCNKAIELNKNSAGPHYVRGKARALIGEWEEALHDIQVADQLDGDCGAYELLKEYREKAEAQKQKRVQREKRKRKEQESKQHDKNEEGFNFGGGAGGFNMGDFLNNPEIMSLLSNPKIQQILGEVMADPSKIGQYMADPEIGPLLQKAMGSFGMGGGAGGFPGGEPSRPSASNPDVDVD